MDIYLDIAHLISPMRKIKGRYKLNSSLLMVLVSVNMLSAINRTCTLHTIKYLSCNNADKLLVIIPILVNMGYLKECLFTSPRHSAPCKRYELTIKGILVIEEFNEAVEARKKRVLEILGKKQLKKP